MYMYIVQRTMYIVHCTLPILKISFCWLCLVTKEIPLFGILAQNICYLIRQMIPMNTEMYFIIKSEKINKVTKVTSVLHNKRTVYVILESHTKYIRNWNGRYCKAPFWVLLLRKTITISPHLWVSGVLSELQIPVSETHQFLPNTSQECAHPLLHPVRFKFR